MTSSLSVSIRMFVLSLAGAVFLLPFFSCTAATEVLLAENSQAKFPIVVAKNASEGVRANAQTLAAYLKKMTGADFLVEEGDGSRGIVLGKTADFSALPKRFDAAPEDQRRIEEYLLYSHPGGLLLVGASDLAAQNAMWDFLGRQGYRQYFPGPTWEIVPSLSRLSAACDEVQKPDYLMRDIWYSGGTSPEREKWFADWRAKNRMQSGMSVKVAHAYQAIVDRHEEAFRSHPEFFAMVNGKREFLKNAKFNMANPELRKLVVEDRLEELRKNPGQNSVSMDPSDGGGWDESGEAKALGSVSDQVISLANEVAVAVGKEFPGRMVGLYAYAYHSAPPTIRVKPNVVILVTTAFRRTPLTLQQQMEGWAKQGASIGIRDYLSVLLWDLDLPSKAKAGSWKTLAKNWKDYYNWGARFYSAESSDNWGIMGFVYYAASRVLWDVNDTAFLDGMQEEFLANCFGPVAGEIRPYYQMLVSRPIVGPDLVNRLYGNIQNAMAKNPDPIIVRRLDDLTFYVRYLELYIRYAETEGEERRQALKDIATHLYRSTTSVMNSTRGVMRSLARESGLAWERKDVLAFRRGTPTWVGGMTPYTHNEAVGFVTEGLKNNARLGYDTIAYSDSLVPAAPLFAGQELPTGEFGTCSKKALYYSWTDKPGATWKIRVTNNGDAARNLRAEVWAADEELQETAADEKELVLKPGQSAEVLLTSPHMGLHRVFLTGQRLGDTVELDSGKPWTITSVPEAPVQSMTYMKPAITAYFYVPKGTRILGMYTQGEGDVLNPDGQIVKSIVSQEGYVKLDVPAGMDGRLWKISRWRGVSIQLLTAPSYFARTPRDLLLPKEVVEKDTAAQ